MLEKLKSLFEFSAKVGFYLPAAYDEEKKGPSVTLLFAHIAFNVAIGMIIALSFKDITQGSIAAMCFSALQTVFYLIRRLSKAKFDLDDKSIDLEGEDDKQTTPESGNK